jgi:hypothetical protein
LLFPGILFYFEEKENSAAFMSLCKRGDVNALHEAVKLCKGSIPITVGSRVQVEPSPLTGTKGSSCFSLNLEPRWQLDVDTENCTKCKALFDFFKRRHHCRICGFIFCDRCNRFQYEGKKCCEACKTKATQGMV